MTDKETMLAFLENQRLEATANYLRRGRHLAHVDVEELNRRWVIEFKQWVPNIGTGSNFNQQPRIDIESEMQVRGTEPPFALVPDDFEAALQASRAQTDRLARDPVKLAQKDRQIGNDIEAFQRSLKESKPN